MCRRIKLCDRHLPNYTKGEEIMNMVSHIIGGTLGLTNEVLSRANETICFSKMTFPHQLFRVMLLEQIYRGFRIMKNEPYHK